MEEGVQSTFVMIKPDSVIAGHIGEIISRIERAGLTISHMKMENLSTDHIDRLYPGFWEKSFYPEFYAYLTSGPVVALQVTGEQAVSRMRQLCGETDPLKAACGSIRADFGVSVSCNAIHSSDSVESAIRECAIFF